MNVVVGLIALIALTYAGKKYSDKFRLRREYYESFLSFSRDMIANAEYKKNTVKSVALNEYSSDDFMRTLSSDGLFTGDGAYFPSYLQKSEREFAKNYFLTAGKNVGRAEKEFLAYADEVIKKKCEECKANDSKYSVLGVKLGFAFGAMIFILVL